MDKSALRADNLEIWSNLVFSDGNKLLTSTSQTLKSQEYNIAHTANMRRTLLSLLCDLCVRGSTYHVDNPDSFLTVVVRQF